LLADDGNVIEVMSIRAITSRFGSPHSAFRGNAAVRIETEPEQLVGSRGNGIQIPAIQRDGMDISSGDQRGDGEESEGMSVECPHLGLLGLLPMTSTEIEYRVDNRG
jgi:hypothetical protein